MREIKFRGKVNRAYFSKADNVDEVDGFVFGTPDTRMLNVSGADKWRKGHEMVDLPSIVAMTRDGWPRSVVVIEDTIGEFCGLQDKNGKDIYEGDILHVIEWENLIAWDKDWNDDPDRFNLFSLDEIKGEKRKEYTSPVFWDEGGFCLGSSPGDKDVPLCCLFGDMKRSAPIFEFEIIGNIYDTKELEK